jgi:hypothetical protein
MRAAPNPRVLTGWSGASPHVLRVRLAGFPPVSRLPTGLVPVVRPRMVSLRPAFSGCSLRPLPGSGSPPVSLRVPFPRALFTLALPRGGAAGAGPGRQGPRSPVLPRPHGWVARQTPFAVSMTGAVGSLSVIATLACRARSAGRWPRRAMPACWPRRPIANVVPGGLMGDRDVFRDGRRRPFATWPGGVRGGRPPWLIWALRPRCARYSS